MVVFATGGQSVRLSGKPLVGSRTCLLERHWLEVAGRDWLTVVPPDF